MKYIWIFGMLAAAATCFFSDAHGDLRDDLLKEPPQQNQTPKYLYKIVSQENWNRSQTSHFVELSIEDEKFIHLATEGQLERIASKYWSSVPAYVVLTLDTSQLPGTLVLEENPGGTTKYYHLYGGSIPLKAIVEAKIVHSK